MLESLLFIRASNENSYRQQETIYEFGRALFPVEIDDQTATGFEYYAIFRLANGSELVYPDVPSGEQPVRVDIVDPEDDTLPTTDLVNTTVLSPIPGEVLDSEDVLIAVALFYDEAEVSGGEFHLLVNGEDVSDEADITPYLIKYIPGVMSEGVKLLQLTLTLNGTVYEVSRWNFRVQSGQSAIYDTFDELSQTGSRPPTGFAEIGVRNQEISGIQNDAYTGRVSVSGREREWSYSLDGYVTSQEKKRLQPQNRLNLELSYTDKYRLQLGDFYPAFNSLSITGRRVRGGHIELGFLDNMIEAEILRGQINRRVKPLYRPIEYEDQFENGQVSGTLYTLKQEDNGFGTYRQFVSATRITYNHSDDLSFSIHGMKIQDDTTSINVIRGYDDLLQTNPSLTDNLRPDDKSYLAQNPDELTIAGFSPAPRGNAVAGMDMTWSLDDDRIHFQSENGMSLLTQNIRGGPLDRQRAAELGLILDDKTEKLFDRLSWLIIINELMDVPPFQYVGDGSGGQIIDPVLPSSIFASDSRLNLRYFDHQVQMRYRWIGPGYQSMANSTIRRDVAGINITDRFRLLENRLYVTLDYENLHDNLTSTRNATQRTTTYRSSVSWYPLNPDLPRLSLTGYTGLLNNGVERFNPFVSLLDPELENAAIRNYRIAGGDTLSAPNPRYRKTLSIRASATQNFEVFGLDHQLIFSYGLSSSKDRYFTFGDSRNRNLSFRLSSRIQTNRLPVRAWLGFNSLNSESLSGLSSVVISGLSTGAETSLMENRLNISAELSMTRNRFESLSFVINNQADPENPALHYYEPADQGEQTVRHTNAYIIRLNVEYEFNRNHSLRADLNLSNITDPLGNLESIPDDRIMQLRYIYRL